MIVLDTTTRSLEVLLGGAVTTNQLPVVAAYVDLLSTTDAYTPAASQTQTNNTTAVAAVAAPAASTTRHLKFLSIQNADTVSATVTVRYNDNGTTRVLQKVVLAVNDVLFYTDGEGWKVTDSTGSLKSGGASSNHNLLSTTHADATAGTVVRGDVITGQGATPTWTRLAVGASGRHLRSDGTDVSWALVTLTTDVTGVLPIANGGTNSATALNNNRIIISSAGAIVEAGAMTNGQLLIGSTGAAPVVAAVTAGTNIAITNGAGSITVGITGVVAIANGGTNSSTALNNSRIIVSSAGAIVEAAALTNGQLLIGSTAAAPVAAALTAGTGITITNGAGSITVAAADLEFLKASHMNAGYGGI